MSGIDWNLRYASGDTPWDTGQANPHLTASMTAWRHAGLPVPARVLEIGCGTGVNAWWLAAQGANVRGIDIAPLAIERAQASTPAELRAHCHFEVADILTGQEPAAAYDLVFDRGVFHVFDDAAVRARFAAEVARVLAPDGQWWSLAGSTEGPPRDHGPPRRSALELVAAVEPSLAIVGLSDVEFHADIPTPARGWWMVAAARVSPAQPSTRRA